MHIDTTMLFWLVSERELQLQVHALLWLWLWLKELAHILERPCRHGCWHLLQVSSQLSITKSLVASGCVACSWCTRHGVLALVHLLGVHMYVGACSHSPYVTVDERQ